MALIMSSAPPTPAPVLEALVCPLCQREYLPVPLRTTVPLLCDCGAPLQPRYEP